MDNHSLRSRKILVLEDDVEEQESILDLLDRLGYHADGVAAVDEALSLIEEVSYGILLISGADRVQEIRQRSKNGIHLILIALTSNSKKDIEEALAKGADDYLSKPIRQTSLEELLEEYMEGLSL